jgi:large subunit ribosomal protein L1
MTIKIADEALLSEVSKGKISFDVLVASPTMMPQLAKVAKILGPKGLMPNPKNGTISDNPQEAVKKLAGGQTNYKTESDHPIIHAVVGKVSFEDNKLKDNISTFLTTVGPDKINSVTLKSTMSPAIRLKV